MPTAPGISKRSDFAPSSEQPSRVKKLWRHLKTPPFDSGTFASAYVMIQFQEDKMISGEDFRKMAEAGDVNEALKLVDDSALYGQLEEGKPEGYELAVNREQEGLLAFLERYSQEKELLDLFRLELDFLNLKLLIKLKKGWLSGTELKETLHPLGFLDEERILELAKIEEFRELWKKLEKYGELLEKLHDELLEEQFVDTLLDHLMFLQFQKLAGSVKSPVLQEITRLRTDFGNIRLLARGRALGRKAQKLTPFFLDGGRVERELFVRLFGQKKGSSEAVYKELEEELRIAYRDFFNIGEITLQNRLDTDIKAGVQELGSSGSLFTLEKLFDNLVIWKANEGRTRHFTRDPLVSYAFGKQGELRNFHIVMTGKVNKLEPDRILSLLRESYGS